jgi:hypothetical protein
MAVTGSGHVGTFDLRMNSDFTSEMRRVSKLWDAMLPQRLTLRVARPLLAQNVFPLGRLAPALDVAPRA